MSVATLATDSADESLDIFSQDTYAQLVDVLKQDQHSADFTKIIEHPGSFSYETTDDYSTTKYEIAFNTVVPSRLLSNDNLQLQSQHGTHVYQPQFTNYAGQVPEDQPNMNYPDSGSTMLRPPTSHSPSPMSLIPSSQTFAGGYNFNFEFGKQPKDTKSTAWTYSAVTNKLYAQKDAMCPIKFRIDGDGVAHGLFIRALPIYSKPEYIQEVVKRCPNHVQAAESANIAHREHFIWCENQGARYVQDPNSGRFAVMMPYDIPPAGTPWVTYLFSFKCLNSCVGGPNRREMAIIYTLENSNQEVLGRVCLDLRICACPGRDRKSDENKMSTQQSKNQSSSTVPPHIPSTVHNVGGPSTLNTPAHALHDTDSSTRTVHERDMLVVAKRSRLDSPSETFTISVKGRKNFEILTRIRDSLEMTEQLVPHTERDRYVQQRRQNDNQYQAQQVFTPPYPQTQQRLPQMSSMFNFSSARQPSFNIKQDVVDSTQRGVDMTDNAEPIAASPELSNCPSNVAEWLRNLSLSAYIDNFHNAGLHSMDQLKSEQNFTIKDLESMNLTKPTVTKIWNSLKGYRMQLNPLSRESSRKTETVTLPDSQGSLTSSHTSPTSSQEATGSQSQGSTVSLGSSGAFSPGHFEFTRCSLKFTITKKNKRSQECSEAGLGSDEQYQSKKHKALQKEKSPE